MPRDTPRFARRSREEEFREFQRKAKALRERLSGDREASIRFLQRAGILMPSGELNPVYDDALGYKGKAKRSRASG